MPSSPWTTTPRPPPPPDPRGATPSTVRPATRRWATVGVRRWNRQVPPSEGGTGRGSAAGRLAADGHHVADLALGGVCGSGRRGLAAVAALAQETPPPAAV